MSILRVISNLFRFNRTNWKAVALCFFTALVFWLFTSLNKDHTTNITFPLQFDFDNERFVAVQTPQQVSINVSGNGWDLLRKSFGIRLPALKIPLDKPTDVKKISGSILLPLVAGQIGSLKTNYVVGDTLNVQIDIKDSHKFRIVADLGDVSFKKGLGRISNVVVLPDSIEIEGPKSILHNLPDSIVIPISASKLNEHFKEEIEVRVPNGELIKRNPPVVEVRFEVGEVEELSWKLKITFRNRPPNVSMEGTQDSINCRILVPKTLGKSILTEDQGSAVADLSGLLKGEFVIQPKPEGLSKIVKVVQIDSVRVRLF